LRGAAARAIVDGTTTSSSRDAAPVPSGEPELLRLEAEELARVAGVLRESAGRLPPTSVIRRDLDAWARRLAFVAQVHGLFDADDG
jgi:hypothetical protein